MTTHPAASFGDLLRRYRQAAGLTQEELAEQANLSARAISELERGARKHPYRSTIQLLAQALALSPTQAAQLAEAGRRPPARRTAPDAPAVAVGAAPDAGEPRHNLPVQLTSFVGRRAELATLHALLLSPAVRLLTLTGPPGTGKTRLSIAVAAACRAAFPDGVCFVELAPVREANLVAAIVAATLGAPAGGLPQFLKQKQLLLVLDNFEQVLEAAPLVVALLQSCPHLKILVTGREALHLRAEKEYPVPPLSLPGANPPAAPAQLLEYEAVRLFVERARDTTPDFALTEDNARAVAQICRRLDGLPLALEIAAARIRLFSPPALLSRLQRSFPLLTGDARDMPARQRTVRAAIGWSYDLLNEPEQRLFRELAIFAGGGTLAAIEAVCLAAGPPDQPGVVELVESLVGKSLLQPREGYGHEPRFVMLELIREDAREHLAGSGELGALCRRHAQYFLAFVEQLAPGFWDTRPTDWLGQLEDEQDNLRAALTWALQDRDAAEQAIALRLCVALWPYWEFRHHFGEGQGWLAAALAQHDSSGRSGRAGAAPGVPDRVRARALVAAGTLVANPTDLDRSRAWLVQGLALSRQLDDTQYVAYALNQLGQIALLAGDYATARAQQEESLALNREQGDESGFALTLDFLGELACEEGDLAAAGAYFAECLHRFRALDRQHRGARALWSKWGVGLALRNLASVALAQDDLAQASALCAEGIVIDQELREVRGVAHFLAIMAGIAARRGTQDRRVATLVGATEAVLEAGAGRLWLIQQRFYERAAQTARERLGPARFEAARHAGRMMSVEQAVAYALAPSP